MVLEGGGDKGAYQAGVIRGMYEVLGDEAKYDVLSGVSAGAVNSIAYSFFDIGKEEEATNYLIEFWRGMTPEDTYQEWPYSYLEGLFWRAGLVNDTVFLSYLEKKIPWKDKITRKVVVGATDAKTGDFIRFTEKLNPRELVFKAGRASTAIPAIFEYVNFQNRTLIDGGVVINLDIGGAVSRCKEAGFKDSDIIIDIVMCSGSVIGEADPSNFNSAEMLYRYIQIVQFQRSMIWISQGLAHFPDVEFRHILFPEKPVDKGFIPIDFSPENIERMIQLGLEKGSR